MNAGQLSAELSEKTGLCFGELQPVEGGMDAAATCFQGGGYFVKLRPDVPVGVTLTTNLSIPGILSPLQILTLSSGIKAIVYEWIDGRDGFNRPLALAHWKEVGRALRQVHDSEEHMSFLPSETFKIQDADSLLTSPLSRQVKENWPQLDWIIRETQTLGRELSRKTWELVPCHADLHVGNILTLEQNVWLIDWDSARLAPRECDLVFFLESGIMGLHGQAEELAFLSGYGRVSVSPELIRYYKLARVLEDLIAFAQEGDETWFLKQFESQVFRNVNTS